MNRQLKIDSIIDFSKTKISEMDRICYMRKNIIDIVFISEYNILNKIDI